MSEAKADKLFAEAEKKLGKFDWFGLTREAKREDAAELFVKAAAQYKIAKNYGRAGEAYEKAADCNMAVKNDIEANTQWKEAGKCWRHVDGLRAIRCYRHAVQHYLDNDRFSQAAKVTEEIGDIYGEEEKLDEAVEAYEESAGYFEAENDTASANKRLLRVAMMSAKAEKYGRSIEIFEKIAKFNVDSSLLRWTVKNHLFHAMLCQLCQQAQADKPNWSKAEEAFEKYQDISDLFASSREAKFVAKLLPAVQNLDMDTFKADILDYDSISKLDAWCTNLLLRVENFIKHQQVAAPDPFGDSGGGGGGAGGYDAGPAAGGFGGAYGSAPARDDEEERKEPAASNPFDAPAADDDAPDLL